MHNKAVPNSAKEYAREVTRNYAIKLGKNVEWNWEKVRQSSCYNLGNWYEKIVARN